MSSFRYAKNFRSNLAGYGIPAEKIMFRLNWYDLNQSSGFWLNAEQLQGGLSWLNFNKEEVADLNLTTFNYNSYVTNNLYLNKLGSFAYILRKNPANGKYYPTYDLASAYINVMYGGYYGNSNTNMPISRWNDRNKCCELSPSDFDTTNGTIHVPANVGSQWKDGTIIALAPQKITFNKAPDNFYEQATEPLTILPTVQYTDPYRNGTVVRTISILDISNFIGTSYAYCNPIYLCLKKISNTVFKPFFFNYHRTLNNSNPSNGSYTVAPKVHQNNSECWDFYNNYDETYYGRIVSAGSGYVFNVYEPKNLLPTGEKVNIVPCLPLYNRKSTPPAGDYTFNNYENAESDPMLSSWLDARYVNLAENKIYVSKVSQFIPSAPVFTTDFYTASNNTAGYITGKMGPAYSGEVVTGMAVMIYRAKQHLKFNYARGYAWAATTEPIVLNGLQTIDGYNIAGGSLILVKDQLNPVENGIYQVNSNGSWQRYGGYNNTLTKKNNIIASNPNANAGDAFWQQGLIINIGYGEQFKGRSFALDSPVTFGTTPVNFYEVESAIVEPRTSKLVPEFAKDTVLPEGLVEGKVYYLIRGENWIQFAASYEEAVYGFALDLKTVGRGLMAVYRADNNPAEPLHRIVSQNPLVTEPLDMAQTFYLINGGRSFALAETYEDAIQGNAIPIYQKPNTYYALVDFVVKARPRTFINNKEDTSFIWSTADTSLDQYSNNKHLLPLGFGSSGAAETLIGITDLPASFEANFKVNPFQWDSDRCSYGSNESYWTEYNEWQIQAYAMDPEPMPYGPPVYPFGSGARIPIYQPLPFDGVYTFNGYYYHPKPIQESATVTCNGITASNKFLQFSPPQYFQGNLLNYGTWNYLYDSVKACEIRDSISQDLADLFNEKNITLTYTSYGTPPFGYTGAQGSAVSKLGNYFKEYVTPFAYDNLVMTTRAKLNQFPLRWCYQSLQDEYPLPYVTTNYTGNERWLFYEGKRAVRKTFRFDYMIPITVWSNQQYYCVTSAYGDTSCYAGYQNSFPDIVGHVTYYDDITVELEVSVNMAINADTLEKYAYVVVNEKLLEQAQGPGYIDVVNDYTRSVFGADDSGKIWNFNWLNSNGFYGNYGGQSLYGIQEAGRGYFTSTMFEASYYSEDGFNFQKLPDTHSTKTWLNKNDGVLTWLHFEYVFYEDPLFYQNYWTTSPVETGIPYDYWDMKGYGNALDQFLGWDRVTLQKTDYMPAGFDVSAVEMMFGNNGVELEFSEFVQHTWKKVTPTGDPTYNQSGNYAVKASSMRSCDFHESNSSFSGSIFCNYDPVFKKHISQELESNGIKFKVEAIPWWTFGGPALRIYGAPNSYFELLFNPLSYYKKDIYEGWSESNTTLTPFRLRTNTIYYKYRTGTLIPNSILDTVSYPSASDLERNLIVKIKHNGHELPILDPNIDANTLDKLGISLYTDNSYSYFTGQPLTFENASAYASFSDLYEAGPSVEVTVGADILNDYGTIIQSKTSVLGTSIYGYPVKQNESKLFGSCVKNPVTLAHVLTINFY